jgi:hypothetical protein
MPGRTVSKHLRVYISGYDFSGYARTIGPLDTSFEEADLTTWADAIMGFLPNHAKLGVGTFNGVLDNTAASGLHIIESATQGTKQIVTVAIGDRAAPVQGVPCFTYQPNQMGYQATESGGAMTVNIPFGDSAVDGATLQYPRGWGVLLEPGTTARTGVNAAIGIDELAATAFGGFFVYHILAGDAGTVTLKVQDAATNLDGSFADLSGATSGSVAASAGVSGIVALSRTATVRQYLRWQLAFGTAATVRWVGAFVRMTF